MVLSLSLIVILGMWVVRTPKDNVPEGNQQEQVLSQTKVYKSTSEDAVVLYYGSTCSYCKVVERWLEENPAIKESSGLVTKEVYENQENSKELTEKARGCEIEGGVGVPFLDDSGQCIVGSQPIIDYLGENYQ